MVLSSGGLRSLVATAAAVRDAPKTRVTLLHVVDGRPNAEVRIEYVRRQADHFENVRAVEVEATHLFAPGPGRQASDTPVGVLTTPSLLLCGLQQAWRLHAGSVVWPASFDADARAMARATEQIELCRYLAEADPTLSSPTTGRSIPELDAPLLELTDRQVVELGGQLEVPFERAWSCFHQLDTPCRGCDGCRRRKRAFDAAGITDPIPPRRSAAA